MSRIARGMREGRSVDPRPLHLKIRVSAPRGTTRAQILDAIETTVELHVVPKGFAFHFIDWRKGEGHRANAGRITAQVARELEAFFAAITHPDTRTRVERVVD